MTIAEAKQEVLEYIIDSDKAISEDEEYIRGWKSAMLTALELLYKLSDSEKDGATVNGHYKITGVK